ncbi:alpha/beta hydrolase-fold protein [soil metagenome]
MSRFRTTKISDPRFERDNLRLITVKSSHLKGRGDICVFVPPGIENSENIPVVTLLHGVYGSAWSWPLNTGVHIKVNEMIMKKELPPMVIAMPSDGLWGDGSAYLPHNGYNFEKWITEDIIYALSEHIEEVSLNSPRFICGLSMGGFGALRIGAKFGRYFRGISGHSSITSLKQMKLFVEEDLANYFQENKIDEDVFSTFLEYRQHLPPVRFDCGASDQLINYNRNLHQQLLENGIDHIYEEYPGAHEWPYWEKHVIKSLLFFAEQLN